MHIATRLTLYLTSILVVAGCAGTQQTTINQPVTSAPRTESARPVMPNPLGVPETFLQSVEAGTRTLTGVPGPGYWQQATRYTMNVRVDTEQKRLEGGSRIDYTNNSPDSLFILHLELAQNVHQPNSVRNERMETTNGVELRRVVIEGQELQTFQGRGPAYAVNGTQLAIVPPNPILPGQTVTLEIDWAFDIPQAGIGERMGYSDDDLLYLGYWYPMMSVYDDVEGWFTDPFRGQAEFYHGFADYDVTIDAPANWIVAGTGVIQNVDEVLAPEVAARMRQAHKSDEPVKILTPADYAGQVTQPGTNGRVQWRLTADQVRDFAFSVMRNYHWDGGRTPVGDRDGDGDVDSTQINAFWRDSAPLWDRMVEYEQHSIDFLSRYTGFPYPWPHMTAVEGGGIIGGGMEFPMMTLIGTYNNAGPEALYNVTAHELAHMWIPMIAANNERRYAWVDEGATTFAENQARMERFPGQNHNLGDQQNYLQIARSGREGEILRWSDFHYNSLAYVNATYFKPASLLVALRQVLGEETFNEAYQSFIETWAYKHPYPWDLFNTFERISGRDLDWFWDSWYSESWTLDQAVARVNAGSNETEIVVEDRGEVPMPVFLSIQLASDETIEREIPVETWLAGANTARITVPATNVTRVEIDPDYAFPDINRRNNVWTR